MSLIATKMKGNMTAVASMLAKMEDDSLDSPKRIRKDAPELIRMVGVKYMTALTPQACRYPRGEQPGESDGAPGPREGSDAKQMN